MILFSILFAASAHTTVLTLDDALRTAAAHQPRLRESSSLKDAAEARVAQARAPLFPQVTGTATYRRTTGNRVYRAGTDPRILAAQAPPTTTLYNFFNFEIQATQLVYDFGQTWGKLDSARASADAQAHDERATRLAVVGDVRLAFFGALAQKELVGVARATVDNQKRHLAQVEEFVAAKTRPDIDLAQARLDVANAEVGFIGTANQYEVAKSELNQAMGVEAGTDYDVASTSIEPVRGEDGPTDALVTAALKGRPEFASLAKQAESFEALERAAKGGYGPALSLGGAVTESGTELGGLRYNYYGLVTLSWPLFQGMLTPARVREAEANLAAVHARVDELRQAVRHEIARAQIAVRAGKATLEAATRALDNAEERLRLAEGRYEAGVGNAIELGDAIIARAAAAAQKVQATVLLSAARAQLLQALGRS